MKPMKKKPIKKTVKKKEPVRHNMWAVKSTKTGNIVFVSTYRSAAALNMLDASEHVKVVITEEDWK